MSVKTTFAAIIEFLNGQKKNITPTFYIFSRAVSFFIGNIVEIFSDGRVAVFLELKINFL